MLEPILAMANGMQPICFPAVGPGGKLNGLVDEMRAEFIGRQAGRSALAEIQREHTDSSSAAPFLPVKSQCMLYMPARECHVR